MLRHRGYIGEAHYGASYAVVPKNPHNTEKYKKMKKTSRKLRPTEEWITIPIPAIIDPALFEKAGNQLKTNFALCQRNKKNEYLLAGKINCVCGQKRAGEGYYNKPNLYYRCTDRTLNFPLPPNCLEKGLNARVADELVWKKVAGLMSSPKLLAEQVERWFKSKHTKSKSILVDEDALKKEINKSNDQLERYNKGYGAGAFTLEQLTAYTSPLREKISQLKTQIAKSNSEATQTQLEAPSERDIKSFTTKAKETLKDLSFSSKRAIILNTVEKVVGNKDHLQVIGYIPVNQNYVRKLSLHRNCGAAQRGQVHPV
jgi:site-specific DNA recombinase